MHLSCFNQIKNDILVCDVVFPNHVYALLVFILNSICLSNSSFYNFVVNTCSQKVHTRQNSHRKCPDGATFNSNMHVCWVMNHDDVCEQINQFKEFWRILLTVNFFLITWCSFLIQERGEIWTKFLRRLLSDNIL